MNVRCPHCSAVFPANLPRDGAGVQVECPLCLHRFEAKNEQTVSAPQWSGAPPLEPRSGGEDEFERFGGPVRGQTSTNIVGLAGQAARSHSATPTVTLGSQRNSQLTALDAGSGEDVDFDSLLGDALQAVDKQVGHRTSAFGRIAGQRAGGAQAAEEVHAPIPSGPAAGVRVTLPGSQSQSGYGNFNPFEDSPSNDLSDPTGALFAQTGGGASTASDDSLFDIPQPERPAWDQDDPLASSAQARPRPQVVKLAKQEPQKKAKGKGLPSLSFDTLLATAMLIAAVGVAMDYAGFGLFGRELYWPAPKPPPKISLRPVPADLATPVALLDTRATYESELARLDRIAQLRPGDADTQQLLERRWLDLMERFPESLKEEAELNKRLEPQMAQLKSPRKLVLDAMAQMQFEAQDELLGKLKLDDPDDASTYARFWLRAFQANLRKQALQSPGLTASAEVDPLRLSGREDPGLQRAHKALTAVLDAGKAGASQLKLLVLDAEIREAMGDLGKLVEQLESVTTRSPDHLEARMQLASVHLELGNLDRTKGLLGVIKESMERVGQPQFKLPLAYLQARLAAREGDRAAMIAALEPLLELFPADELLVVRLGRLYLAEKRTQDAQKLLTGAKEAHKLESIAFEVVLVELWLQINRPEDALEEIKQATVKHPESLELVYVRGQVEDKQQHFATARDLFAEVLRKQPQHLRAAVRLAELQILAKRYDEALDTLTRTRAAVGDEETLVRMSADVLLSLKRAADARAAVDLLLKLQPSNRSYLLLAARLDLQQGKTQEALTYLRKLREQKNLDRDAAVAMAEALAQRGDLREAADTITPFADAEPSAVALNTLAGRLQMDAGNLDRAQVLLSRAVDAAAGKVAETQFQWGRLAFAQRDVQSGVLRVRQAIGLDATATQYRYELASQLLRLTSDKASRALAIEQLQSIVTSARALKEQGKPVTNLAAVHKLLAKALLLENRFSQAVPSLRAALEMDDNDWDARTELGRALYMMGKEEGIEELRRVLRARPSDPKAALYLALHLVREGKQTEAVQLLQRAVAADNPEYAEAYYHLALLYKERAEPIKAYKLLQRYLEVAKPSDPYRSDAESVKKALARQLGDSDR